ncbi:formin-like protein 11-like [Trifolium pratense]|uniref:Formin-like protein n=2 Tax=Trifolium TaxID=3898 RepID=A0A2K3MQ19_TRIPR|nr:formin-like protein 11-like [Trifolium pratense]
MSFGSEFLTMFFIIITFLIALSSQRIHILSVGALINSAGSFHVHSLQESYFLKEKNEEQNEKFQVVKISGLDENEVKHGFIVEKFRSLLGLKSFHKRVHSKSNSDSDSDQFLTPSPSPSQNIEAEVALAPAPAPAPTPSGLIHFHPHSHHQKQHHFHWNNPSKKFHHDDDDRGRTKKILVAVFVSIGILSLVSVFGLILFCRKKFTNHKKKKPKRTMPICSKTKDKVSLNNQGLDLFYLDALGEDIEQQCSTTLKNTNDDDNNVSSSSFTKEIVEMELVKKNENDYVVDDEKNSSSCVDEIVNEDCDSSEDESFHSFVDSQANSRLSNASICSLSDTHSLVSPQNSFSLLPNQTFPSSPQNSIIVTNTNDSHQPQLPFSPKQKDQEIENENETFVQLQSPPPPPPTPPPPPPPTPPLKMPLFTLHSLTSSSRVSSHSPLSLTSHTLSSPMNSESSSRSNQSPEKDSFSPSPSPPNLTKSPLGSIPPPPFPPPFPKGNNNNNGKTPPPPPYQFPQSPLGKDGTPLAKLKPLHWDKVRAAPNRTMVWDKLRSSSFELDEEMIESLFGYNLQNSINNDESKSKTPSPGKHVLDPKRLQNITILSKALNATAEQVCDALMQGKGLSLPQLEALVKMVPTKEEEAKLFNYKGNINELGSAERFVRAVLSVPFAFQRVETMLYKETFDDEVVHLRNSFSMLEEACKELRSSRLFLKLLEAVLKTGNRMNVGTIRGGARAFKLDALLKLADVKGTDGKTTLLHFVVQEIVRSEGIRVSDSIMGKISQKSNKNRTEEEKEEDYRKMGLELVSGLSTELYNVKKTATIDLDVLASSVSNLYDGMIMMKQLVENELHEDEMSHNFVMTMKIFLQYVDGNLKELRGEEDRVIARVKEITEYFHGDVSKEDNPLRIFVIVRDFMGMLDNVCKELRKSKGSRTPNPLAPFR